MIKQQDTHTHSPTNTLKMTTVHTITTIMSNEKNKQIHILKHIKLINLNVCILITTRTQGSSPVFI
jgi:tRNA(Ile2) C34 agmatinyltransferase TiaS